MSQIEDLLRDALTGAPTPATSTVDPLSDLDRRIGQARVRRAGVAIVGVIAVVLAIVLPLSLQSSSAPRPAVSSPPPSPVTKLHGFGGAVASGGGYVWSLRQDLHHTDAATGAQDGVVAQRAPGNLQVVRTFRVPGPVDFITYGLNRVWVWGGGDGGFPNAKLSVVDPVDQHVTTMPFGHGRPIGDLAFAGGRAWLLGELPTQIVPVEGRGDHLRFGHPIGAPGATRLAASGSLVFALGPPNLPSGREDTVVIFAAVRGASPGVPRPDGHIVLVLPHGYLVVRQHRLVTENADGTVVGSVLPGRVGLAAATMDSASGIVYATTIQGDCRFHHCERLLQYSVSALANGTGHPTASARGSHDALNLAADPSGALLVTDGESTYRWVPSPLR